MRRAVVIGVMFVAVVGMFSCGLQALVGVGFTYTGQVPYGTVIGQWGSFGVEAGIGTASRSHTEIGGSVTEIWYCANGKYFLTLPVLGEALQPYLGGGIVGLIINESMQVSGGTTVTISASVVGGEVLGGLQYSFASLGLPVVISGGASYMTVAEMTVTYVDADGTVTATIVLPSGGIGVRFGIHVAF